MGKAEALPRPYFTGEGRVAVMLGAAPSTPRGVWVSVGPQAAPAAGAVPLAGLCQSCRNSNFQLQKVMGLGGLVFFFFSPSFVPRGRNGISVPLPAGRLGPTGLGVLQGGPATYRLENLAQGTTCHLPAAQPQGSCRQPVALCGLGTVWARLRHGWGTVWARLGHGLGTVWACPATAWACPMQRCCCWIRGSRDP